MRYQLGEAEAALEDAGRVLEREPERLWSMSLRAQALYCLARYREAAETVARMQEIDPEAAAYMAPSVRAYLLRAGDPGEADAEFARLRALGAVDDDGEGDLLAFLEGALTEEELLARTAARDLRAGNGQPVELARHLFFAGLERWRAGDLDGARDLRERCVETEAHDCDWYAAARVDLARLEER